MKIVCDNCATKYSIADEKVRGKVFKIRCKKCSHIIVVRGGADGNVEASREPAPAADNFPG
ncbi:MAG: zinc-ribbon domain-containing protein, partial [Polyangia bacterium]